ncbi:MAG TPA: hypothetical protein VKI17_04695, partial [Gemmataceae bacterium]|nr:hypothetical protein [Gemmataceae bacterium]
DAVDEDARSQRIARIGQPLGELQAATGRGRNGAWLVAFPEVGQAARDRRASASTSPRTWM